MAQAKRNKGKKKKQNPELPVPSFNELIKSTGENNTANINKQENQKLIQILPIPEQVVVVKDNKWGKWGFWTQFALVCCSLGMLILVYIMSSTQNRITNDTLNFQIRKTYSDSISQHRKDSLNIAIAESANAMTRKSISDQERLAKDEMRPYLYITKIDNLIIKVDKGTKLNYEMTNVGKTPAINVRSSEIFVFDEDSLNVAAKHISNVLRKLRWRSEMTIGTNIPITNFCNFPNTRFSRQDSINVVHNILPVFLLIGIEYNDKFGERDSTWTCFKFDSTGEARTYIKLNAYK